MKLAHIDLCKLGVSPANMRAGRKAPDISDLLPSIRARGVLVPILVRPNGTGETFEVVAGRRRYEAARIVATEGDASDRERKSLPCAIIGAGDDAAALEASLIENIARLDPDEVTRWETFTRLVRAGRSVEDISATFGLTELGVRRTLALGNLLPRIRDLYRNGKADAATVRHLTLASKSQQKAWLALADDPKAYCPTGHQLKAWLFGGQAIAASHALFDVAASGLATVADLFGGDRFIADGDAFWVAQDAAIAAKRAAYVEQGWADAIVVPPAETFSTWEYVKAGKRKGGRVYFDVRATGEVIVHEGYLPAKEAARRAKGEPEAERPRAVRPELTGGLQAYVDLHRHAAVRAVLTGFPAVALRLLVAHAIAGSHLWRLSSEPQAARSDAIRDSVADSPAEADFDGKRRAVLAVLGLSPDEPTVVGATADGGLVGLFDRLLALSDAAVLEVVAIVIGETLASGSAAVEAAGLVLGVDMAACWQADDAVFDLIRDRELLGRIVADVAGETVAAANAKEKGATLKRIVRDHLDGVGGRTRCDGWVPRWMTFPPSAYTARGGVGTVVAHAAAQAAIDLARRPTGGDDPDPAAPGAAIALSAPDIATAPALAA